MSSSDILNLGRKLAAEGPHKLEKSPRRVRLLFGQEYIADTQEAHYVWEHPYYPQYWLPVSTLHNAKLTNETSHPEGFTTATLSTPTSHISNILSLPSGPLAHLIRIPFNSPGLTWFEEDQAITVHPKDPYKRVDILPASRHIEIALEGTVLASSRNVLHLFETGLPTRRYLPMTSVADWKLLRESATRSRCPYKGEARYFDVLLPGGKEVRDVVWWYEHPTSESVAIAGRMCWYDERVDVWVDGVKQERPVTKFGGQKAKEEAKGGEAGKEGVGGLPVVGMSHDKAMFGKAG